MYGHSGTTVMAEWALNQLLLFYLSLYMFCELYVCKCVLLVHLCMTLI